MGWSERAGARTRSSVAWRRWTAVLTLLTFGSVLGVSCTGDDADVHPWLRENVDDSAADEPPTSYPHRVETANGASVTYYRGPTAGGYAWEVVFHSRDGSVEIHEMDDYGNVQMRTYGTMGTSPAEDDAAP